MRPARLAPLLVFGLFLAGCGGGTGGGQPHTDNPGATPPPTSATAPNGVVQGQIQRPPGPDPRSGKIGDPVPVSGDPVHAKDTGGKTVANAVTGPDGHFELTLPPGRYEITEDTCGVGQQVDVRSGTTTAVRLSITNAC